MKSSVVVLLAALCLTVNFQPGAVMDVVDGDTFDLYHVGVPAKERIRVLGVDTPERGKPNAAMAVSWSRVRSRSGPRSGPTPDSSWLKIARNIPRFPKRAYSRYSLNRSMAIVVP